MGYTDWLVDYCDSYLYRGGNWAAGGTSTGKKRKVDDDSCFDRGDNWAAAGTTTGEKRKVDDDVSKWTSVDGEWRPRPPAPPPPPEYFDKMAAFYLEAIRRLPVADMPYLARCVCFGGLTVGLADPVNNIILSAIVLYVHSHLSAVKVKLPATKESFLDVARRSYAGAVFFMQYHFRYLTKARAAHYLRLAGQDLALATQLVQSRRLNGVFHTDLDPRSPRIRSALKLAACEAKYPVPDHLVRFMVWSVPLPLLNPILDDLQQGKALSLQRVAEIMYLLRHLPAIISDTDPLGGPDLGHFSCLTSSSISKERRMLSTAVREAEMAADPDEELYTKMEEQDIAHLMYIKALSVLPTDALRQHGLLGAVLKAGHCCGPFHPVVNIVFNSICYKAGVLRLGNETQAAEDDVLDTRSMTPIESCFCHSQKLVMSSLDISLKQPLQRLQDQVVLYRRFLDKISLPSKGKFHDAAITYFRNLTHEQIYELCSILAKHDFFNGPDQHNQFMPLGSDSLASLEKALSLQPIGVFNSLLENEPRVQQMSCYQAPQQHFVRTQLENLLLEYSRSSHWGSEYNYKLGLICGVASAQYGCTKICYHVNFLASVCEDERSELFFAEFWCPSDLGMEDSTKRPMCCPIDHLLSELGRCFICEAGNSRLVHPSSKEYFLGKTIAFEDLCMIARKGASAVHNGTSDHHGAEYKDSA